MATSPRTNPIGRKANVILSARARKTIVRCAISKSRPASRDSACASPVIVGREAAVGTFTIGRNLASDEMTRFACAPTLNKLHVRSVRNTKRCSRCTGRCTTSIRNVIAGITSTGGFCVRSLRPSRSPGASRKVLICGGGRKTRTNSIIAMAKRVGR